MGILLDQSHRMSIIRFFLCRILYRKFYFNSSCIETLVINATNVRRTLSGTHVSIDEYDFQCNTLVFGEISYAIIPY